MYAFRMIFFLPRKHFNVSFLYLLNYSFLSCIKIMTMVIHIFYKVFTCSNRAKTAVGLWPDPFSMGSGSYPLVWHCYLYNWRGPQRLGFPGRDMEYHLASPYYAHLLKSVTSHTFASAGVLPHAAPTIWTELFLLNHQYHLPTTNTIGQFWRKIRKNWEGRVSVLMLLDLENVGTGRKPHPPYYFAFQKKYK